MLDFEKDGIAFREKWQEETEKLKEKVRNAREALKTVEVSPAMIQLAAVYTLKAHVAGHRADIYLIEAARAEAALEGRKYVLPKDLEKAAEFVLPHRMRKAEEEQQEPQQPEEEPQQPEENKEDQQQPQNEPADENAFSRRRRTPKIQKTAIRTAIRKIPNFPILKEKAGNGLMPLISM